MSDRRYWGVGLLMLIAGGCAASHRPTVASGRSKTAAPPTTEKVQWLTSGTPSVGALTSRTSDYASKLQGYNTTDPANNPDLIPPPEPSAALLKPVHHRNVPPAERDNLQLAVDPPIGVPNPPVAQVASAKITPANSTWPTDGPKIVPESADFALTASQSKDALGTRLRKRVHDDPRDIANQLDLQLYGMLNDDPAPELAAVTDLPAEDRELVAALIDGISNFRSMVREDSNMLQTGKIQPLLEMADRLRSQADLTVSTVALCRRVDAFGKYDPISPLRFPAAQDNAAIVYCEVQNFVPKQNSQQMWQTRLSEQVTLYTDQGVIAWSDSARQVTDECRNRRHDFFAYNIIKLPSSLTMGRYVLKVHIEDQNANRMAEKNVPLEIVGKAILTDGR